MPYSLKFDDRQSKVSLTPSLSFDPVLCEQGFIILGEGLNRLELAVTAEQFKKLFSAMMVGSELLWPDDNQDLQALLLQAASCPINSEDAGCIEYSPSASFIKFFPDNPYILDDKSAGWNKEAWFRWGNFDTLFPDWIDNWISGFVGSLTGYEQNDILFNIESLPINPIDAFLSGGGILPKIEIRFSGTGVIEVELLTFPLGGRAIIELDNEPNALDILTGGIIDPNSFLVELNRDILSFPPEEYPVLNVEIPVETAGNHVLYIVFLPSVDDSLLPIGFGGGIRSVELCGLEQVGTMGIEQIVWNGCELQAITGGVPSTIVTAAEIQACLDIPEGGGGGAANLIVTNLNSTDLAADSDNNTEYDNVPRRPVSHSFTKSKAWIRATISVNNTTTGEDTFARVAIPTTGGVTVSSRNEGGLRGTAGRDIVIDAFFENVPSGSRQIYVEMRTSSGGVFQVAGNTYTTYTIVEFENASDLFVEDVRIFEGELQKKIGGVWIAITDSFEAIINSLQSQVSAAAANAASAVSTSNNALTVAQGAVNVNNTQNTRLNALEAFQEDAELSLSQLSLTVNDHESRIDALEASLGATLKWETYYDFMASDNGWSGNPYVNGLGFAFGNGLPLILSKNSIVVVDSRVEMIEVEISQHNALEDFLISFPISSNEGNIRLSSGGFTLNWLAVPAMQIPYTPVLRMPNPPLSTRYLRKLRVIGFGSFNPFI